MHPELPRQLGDRPVPSDRRQRHLRLEPRIMFLPCPLHVLLPRYPRVLGAGLHLSQLSHFRGPPQSSLPEPPQKERYAMLKGTTVVRFRQPDAIDDPLSELAREGARRMLAQALVAEADAFVALWKDSKLPDGRDRVVRHGHGPHRAIQTGVGPVEVRRAKVRDRGEVGAEEKIRFTSSILPKWARRTKTLDALLPVLYLRGVSTGDFQEALTAL